MGFGRAQFGAFSGYHTNDDDGIGELNFFAFHDVS